MTTIKFLLILTCLVSFGSAAQEYYDDTYPEDEGSFSSEMQPPVSDDYYLSEELERQEEMDYQEAPQEEWNLEGEELPVDEYGY